MTRRNTDPRSSGSPSPSLLDALVLPAAGTILLVITAVAAVQVAAGLMRVLREPSWVSTIRDELDAEALEVLEHGDLLSRAWRGVSMQTAKPFGVA